MLKKISINKNSDIYPYVLIPNRIINFLNRDIKDQEIVEFLGYEYPKLDLKIYYHSEFRTDLNNFSGDDKLYKYVHIEKNADLPSKYIAYESYLIGSLKLAPRQFHPNIIKLGAYLKNVSDFLNPDKDFKYGVNRINIITEEHQYFIGKYKIPKRPEKTKAIYIKEVGCLFYFLVFLILFSSIVLYKYFSFYSLIYFFMSILILYYFKDNISSEVQKDEIIEKKIYKKQFNKFLSDIDSIKDKVKVDYSSSKLVIDRIVNENRMKVEKLLLKEKLNPYYSLELKLTEYKRGKSELFFLDKLYERFENQVYVDISITDTKSSYYPDFVLISKKTGFHLDIEIDEPYSINNGEPIHHNRSNDTKRDSYFTNINWGVIRFTEKQVINNYKSCCDLIESLLFGIENNNIDKIYSNIPIEKKWTYEQSLIMSNNNYRNSYLPKNMKIRVIRKRNDNFDDLLSF